MMAKDGYFKFLWTLVMFDNQFYLYLCVFICTASFLTALYRANCYKNVVYLCQQKRGEDTSGKWNQI